MQPETYSDTSREQARDWLPLECYTDDHVFAGHIRWPIGLRLLDLLNSLYATEHDSAGEFLDFIDISEYRENDHSQTFINKSSVEMVAISDANLARGAGTESNSRSYPFIPKAEVQVSLRLKMYVITGNMHCAEGQTFQDVINQPNLFLPMTDVTIATAENRFYATRPFLAVNRQHVVWVRVEKRE